MQPIEQGEAKSIEQDYKQIYTDTARLTAALIAEILQKLKKSPELKVELEDEKQPKVEIKVGREIAYRGVEGQTPEVNKLTPQQVEYLADALAQPAADQSSAPTQMNRAVTIKVNDKVVYKLSKGVVEINKLQPELAAEIAKSISPPERSSASPISVSSEPNKTPEKATPVQQKSPEFSEPSVESVKAVQQPVVIPREPELEIDLWQPEQEQLAELGTDFQRVEDQEQLAEVGADSQITESATEAQQQSSSQVEASTEVRQQSPHNVEDDFIQSLIVLQRRVEQSVQEPALKQWLNKAVNAFKEAPKKAQQALKQAPGQVINAVRSTPEMMRDRAIATTALDLFHRMPYRGAQDNVYKGEGYAIESEGKDVYSIKNNDNREVMRFKHTVLGPRVIENNMTSGEQRDFLQVRNQMQKYGLDDIASSDSFNQVAQLGKLAPAGTTEVKQNLVNRSVALNALSVVENFGKDTAEGEKVFEGKNYRIEQKDYGLTITAQDGRGVILQSQAGEIKANLSPKDISQFNIIGKKIDNVRQQLGQPENSVIQTAEKLVQTFGKERADGTRVFEGKNSYQIQQKGDNLTITDKNDRGVILQRQNGQVKANLSPQDISKFNVIGDEFTKREMKQVASVIQTAKNIVQCLGKETTPGLKVFDGKTYQIQQRGNDVSISAKNGRGEILRHQGGTTLTDLSPQDISKFEATGRELDKHLAVAAQPVHSRQSKAGVELGA